MTTSPNTDGQIGMEDVIVNDPEIYKLVKKWHAAELKVPNANKARKDRDNAKTDVKDKLELTDDPTRFRFVVEEEPVVYVIVAKPPTKKTSTSEGPRTIHFNHRLEVDAVEG